MKYKDFARSDSGDSAPRLTARLCRVTYMTGHSDLRCECLEWENSNAKWYRLEPFEGREECGYVNEIFIPASGDAVIEDIQVITVYGGDK